jgi:hypothetical protein
MLQSDQKIHHKPWSKYATDQPMAATAAAHLP